ncbi:MAG: ABC transporter ATP-binding protein, partial [Candidatus Odinarchaeota archaeon]|nr:ABC transporter ATP-binding protein [Candidatus Odinarchaeota archaeon]
FYTYEGVVKALEGVNLELYKGKVLGLVGETGCGKSVTALSVMRLVPSPPGKIVGGKIIFDGRNLLELSEEEMRKIRGKEIAMVFQDPMTYLNPVFTIGDQIMEVILQHQDLRRDVIEMKIDELREELKEYEKKLNEGQLSKDAFEMKRKEIEELISKYEEMKKDPPEFGREDLLKAAKKKAIETLRAVRMPHPEQVINQYPHELSGGMRQRAMIAMMLSCRPKVFISDESTTALDVTIQAQILRLIKELKEKLNMSVIFITHDLGIVAQMCDYVAVMYAGTVAEFTDVHTLFKKPLHPYTNGLLNAIPKLYVKEHRLETIPGNVPNLIDPPPGCRFHPRCPYAMEICRKVVPPLVEVEPGHKVACHLYYKIEGDKIVLREESEVEELKKKYDRYKKSGDDGK